MHIEPLGSVWDFEADVLKVLVAPGDAINEEDPIIEIETEKATVEVPAPHAGSISEVLVAAGDTIKVGVRIVEGKRERIQYFEGVCIAKKNRNINSSFTVRKISFGEGVERTFALYSSIISSIKVVRSGKVKRAKLYYLRSRKGKSARISEKIKKSIGIDVSEKVVENETVENAEDNETKTKLEAKKENLTEDRGVAPQKKLKKEELKTEKK